MHLITTISVKKSKQSGVGEGKVAKMHLDMNYKYNILKSIFVSFQKLVAGTEINFKLVINLARSNYLLFTIPLIF